MEADFRECYFYKFLTIVMRITNKVKDELNEEKMELRAIICFEHLR